MNLSELKTLLQAKEITNYISLDIEINSVVASDLMSDILHSNASAELLLTGLANNQAVRTCEIAGIKAIIFVRGKSPPQETIKLAEECNIPLLTCDYSMFEACGILYSKGLKTPR
ncbi:MAG: transcriptional regulator [candidate division WOR-3 bacterium]